MDAFLFAVIAWRVYRLSLPWAIAGLLIFAFEKVYGFATNPRTGAGTIVALIFFFYYLHAVRAGIFLRQEKRALIGNTIAKY